MAATEAGIRIELKNILFLTDFSEPSDAALPFAIAIASKYGATLHALHVLIPQTYTYTTPELGTLALEGQEQYATEQMKNVEARMAGVPHHVRIVRGLEIWPVLEETMQIYSADMLVLGTHGRTGAGKLLMGSAAEEIFRKSSVPVMTVGPMVPHEREAARLQRILFATDFSEQAKAAIPYAVSLALENRAELVLLHVMPNRAETRAPQALSVAEALHQLHELVPEDAQLPSRVEAIVRYGKPGATILSAADEKGADLIVLGVRGARGVPGAATHLGMTVAHSVVAHAKCPVLTVRG